MAGFLPRTALVVLAALALCACVPGLGTAKKPAGPNPVTGSEIVVTPLDDAAAPPPADAAKAAPPPDATRPKPRPEQAPAAAPPSAPAEAAPLVGAPVVPEVKKSAAQIACEKKKGVWAKVGAGAHGCVTYTRDGGKACDRAQQCDSACLARSGTCAPYKPLVGCNDILDDQGRRMTQCLE